MIQFDFFESIRHVNPIHKELTYEQFKNELYDVELAYSKELRNKCFSFTKYAAGKTRAKDNIHFMTGLVFDFDNKDCDPVEIKDVTKTLELNKLMHFWYHTYSCTLGLLKWRLIIPFNEPLFIRKWEEIYERGLLLIGNPPGIDPVSRKSAQIYFYPYKPRAIDFKLEVEAVNGDQLNPNDLPAFIKKEEEKAPIIEYAPISDKIKRNETYHKIKRALNYISPDVEYSDWIKLGMAIKNELGDSGIHIWHDWSRGGQKYKGIQEINYRWRSFNGSGVSIGSLYSLAIDRGFKINDKIVIRKDETDVDERLIECESLEDLIDRYIKILSEFVCRDVYDIPDPVLKELYEWIESSSYIYQPVYSLATAISFMGFLKRNIICSPTNIKPNLYILSMGPSRSGKNNGLQRIYQLLKSLNLDSYLITGIGSHQGLLRQMNQNDGSVFVCNDEISYLISSMQNKNAATHEKNIEQKILSLYNCKFQTSDAIKGEKVEKVNDPFLHIYSTTTENISHILKTESVTSGLLARFLIFTVEPGFEFKENLDPYEEPPITLAYSLQEISKGKVIRKAIMEKNAEIWFKQFRETTRRIQQILNKEHTKIDSLVGNLCEQAIKISLLSAQFKENVSIGTGKSALIAEKWPFIRLEDIQWGVAVAIYCLKNMVSLASNFYDNIYERILKKMRSRLKEKTGGDVWINKSDLYKQVSCPNLAIFDGFIKHLYQSDEINIQKNHGSRGIKIQWANKKKSTFKDQLDIIEKTKEKDLKDKKPEKELEW